MRNSLDLGTELFTNEILDPNRLFVSRCPTPLSARSTLSKSFDIGLNSIAEGLEFGIAWVNLSYSPTKYWSSPSKTILRNISGSIKFGQIVGLMGPSGCGKSTLLNCINGRITQNLSTDTEIYISARRTIHSCFIVQDQKEHLLMGLTVKESLLYASKIKNQNIDSDIDSLDESIISRRTSTLGLVINDTDFDHNANVNKLLSDLTLNDCADTLIANCSGGQQKRIVCALELVGQQKPNMICIDEPTSGLDSNAAEQVIDCLRNISRDHSIGIITTIHQPNSDVLSMFDTLYVLSKGGYCVYNGRPELLREFLKSSNIPITETQVPIEVLIKVASKTTFNFDNTETFEIHEQIKTLASIVSSNDQQLRHKCKTFGKLSDVRSINRDSLGFSFTHFWYLIERTFLCNIIRGWKSILFISLFELFGGLLAALLFGKSGVDDGCVPFNPYEPQNVTCIPIDPTRNLNEEQQTIQNFKFLFFSLILHNFLHMCHNVLTFPLEVRIIFNEQHNRWYSSSSYYWSKNLVDSLYVIIITTLYSIITYVGTGQIGMLFGNRFGLYLIANILSALCTQGMSNTFSIISPQSLKITLCLAIGGNLSNTLFSGFMIPIHQMNNILQKISYLSYIKAALETQAIAVYGLSRCDPNRQQWSSILYMTGIKERIHFNITLLIIQLMVWRIFALISLIIKTNGIKMIFK